MIRKKLSFLDSFSCYKFQSKGLLPENELLVLVTILCSQI